MARQDGEECKCHQKWPRRSLFGRHRRRRLRRLSSALLLLRSGNERHPKGLPNGSNQVGRNYMRHNQSILMALMHEPDDTVFQKTLAISDYYFGSDDWDYPLGLIQMCAKSHGAQICGEAVPGWLEWVPKMPFEEMARHSMDFWLASEDLPRSKNRVFYGGDRVLLDIKEGNMEAHRRLKKKLEAPARIPYCWSGACTSARILRSEVPRIRRGPRGSERIPRHRYSISTARRTSLTISISPMPVSLHRSDRSIRP